MLDKDKISKILNDFHKDVHKPNLTYSEREGYISMYSSRISSVDRVSTILSEFSYYTDGMNCNSAKYKAIVDKFSSWVYCQVLYPDAIVMDIRNFVKAVSLGCFNCFDGYGFYCDEEGTKSNDFIIFHSSVLENMANKYPYILWYEKCKH